MSETNLRDHFFATLIKVDSAAIEIGGVINSVSVGRVFGELDRQLYEGIVDFARKTRLPVVDPRSLFQFLQQESELDELGEAGVRKIFRDLDKIASPLPVRDVIALMRNEIARQRMTKNSEELHEILFAKRVKSEDDKRRIRELTQQIQKDSSEIAYDPFEAVDSVEAILAESHVLSERPPFLPTPYVDLNRALGYEDDGGFLRGQIHAIVAATGTGKTVFCMELMRHWLDQELRCVYANYEMPTHLWNNALCGQITGKNPIKYHKDEEILAEILPKFRSHIEGWGDRLYRWKPDSIFFDDLEQRIASMHETKKVDVLFIDTIQSMYVRGISKRFEQFEHMMVRLERLALDLGICVVLTVQENRDRTKERRSTALGSDTAGSKTIEEKSSVAIHMVMPRVSGEDDIGRAPYTELHITKNRTVGVNSQPGMTLPRISYDDDRKGFLPFDGLATDFDFSVSEDDSVAW